MEAVRQRLANRRARWQAVTTSNAATSSSSLPGAPPPWRTARPRAYADGMPPSVNLPSTRRSPWATLQISPAAGPSPPSASHSGANAGTSGFGHRQHPISRSIRDTFDGGSAPRDDETVSETIERLLDAAAAAAPSDSDERERLRRIRARLDGAGSADPMSASRRQDTRTYGGGTAAVGSGNPYLRRRIFGDSAVPESQRGGRGSRLAVEDDGETVLDVETDDDLVDEDDDGDLDLSRDRHRRHVRRRLSAGTRRLTGTIATDNTATITRQGTEAAGMPPPTLGSRDDWSLSPWIPPSSESDARLRPTQQYRSENVSRVTRHSADAPYLGMLGGGNTPWSGYHSTSSFFPLESDVRDVLGLTWDEHGEHLYVATGEAVWDWRVDTIARRCTSSYELA